MSERYATLLRQAVGLHQQGNLAAAEALYRQVLQAEPDNLDAQHFLGLAALQGGRTEDAIRLIGQAVAAAPERPHFHSNLGTALRAAGRLEEAVRCYDRAIALAPDYAEAFNNRGVALDQLDRTGEALGCFEQAIALRPEYAEAHYNRGNALKKQRRRVEAVLSYDRAIELRPRYEEALNNRGTLQQLLRRHQDALASFAAAIALRPDNVDAIYNHANILSELGRKEEAVAGYQRAIALRPDYTEALNNCGNTWLALNHPDEALTCFDRATALRPDMAELSNNRATALLLLNRHEEALAACNRALRIRPDYPEARMNRGMCRLSLGDFAQGWRDYEWRWRVPVQQNLARKVRERCWVDQPDIDGKTVLLHAEQGFGDTLQFCRYVPLVAARASVILEVPPTLSRLMATLDGGARIVAYGDTLPPFDLHCPLLSVPLVLGTTLESIPRTVPYLRAGTEATEAWRRRLAALPPGLRVGLVWAGRRRADVQATDSRRSMALHQFAAVAAIPGVSLVSLQTGEPAVQVAARPAGMAIEDWTDELGDFADTAALVAALDLVISVDTAVAHLAGALDKEVWILSRFDACWRWLIDRDDSPWYPTARLFRQPAPADWDSVIARVCEDLRRRASRNGPGDDPGGV